MKYLIGVFMAILLSNSAFANAALEPGDLVIFEVITPVKVPFNEDGVCWAGNNSVMDYVTFIAKTTERYDRVVPAGTILVTKISFLNTNSNNEAYIELVNTDPSSSIQLLTLEAAENRNFLTEDGLINNIGIVSNNGLKLIETVPNHTGAVIIH